MNRSLRTPFPFSVIITAALLLASAAALALPPQSDSASLRAVPAKGAVKIDGDLSEWDASAPMLVYPVRALRERYAVRVHAMWDTDALYLGLIWRDPSPMINNVDADAVPHEGWMSDCFQGRFTTDRNIHFTAWHSSQSRKCVAMFEYHHAGNADGRKLLRGEGTAVRDGSGFEMAFRCDGDGRGYVQEMRIPWGLLFAKPEPRAGLRFHFSGEYFWGGPQGNKWPAVMWADPVNPKNPSRIVLYQNPGAWGELELLDRGDLPKPTSGDDDDDSRLQGPVPIRVEVPADAARFTLAIDDASGRRVRNLASHANVADYLVKTADGKRVIEVPWDGLADGPWDKERMLFVGPPAAVGDYVVRVQVHGGVGVRYAGSFYSPGRPPWETPDSTGGWGFDHTPPLAVAAVPKESKSRARVFLGWGVGECGSGLIGVDSDGRKLWAWARRSQGVRALAASADRLFILHYEGRTLSMADPDTGAVVKFPSGGAEVKLPAEARTLELRDGRLILAAKGKAGDVRLTVSLPGGEVREEPAPAEPVPAAVGKPLARTRDSAGNLYVADAADMTVKVFAPGSDKPTVTIGEPGGRRPGPWNPQRMRDPVAAAVEERPDGTRRVWVTEADFSPRRVSVWDAATGRLVRDFIGNTRYSGSGGHLSDDSPDMGIVDGVIFKIDYAAQTYIPVEVMGGRPDPAEGKTARFGLRAFDTGGFGNGIHFVSDVSGKPVEYYVEGFGAPMVFMRRGGRWMCVAAMGTADVKFPAGFPAPPSPDAVFAWNDLNGDGFQSPDEVGWSVPPRKEVFRRRGWGYRCGRDLAWYHSGLAFRPVRFAADGAPVYDVAKAGPLPGEAAEAKGELYPTGFGWVGSRGKGEVVDRNGVVFGHNEFVGYDKAGRLRWTYPNYWVAVHGAMSAPMAMPGVVMGSLKFTGVAGVGGAEVFGVRGNIGQEFLIGTDGLYVAELFTDQRMAPASMPAERDLTRLVGLPINDTTIGGEPFNGWLGRQSDGKVRMTYGYTDVRIAEVTGLDTVRRLPDVPLRLTEELAAKARAFTPKGVKEEAKAVAVRRVADPKKAGAGTPLIVRSGREEVARVWLDWDDAHLYMKWEVASGRPPRNATPPGTPGELPLAFKSGDGVDLFLAPDGATAGGVRLLLAPVGDKPAAVLYRPAGPDGSPFEFRSPVRSVRFPHAGAEPSVKAKLSAGGPGYTATAAIPWAVLGVTPKAGLTLRGDVGVLLADDTGRATARRVRWADRQTNVVNDVPTEAEFSPVRWGTFRLE